MSRPPPKSTLFPYPPPFGSWRSVWDAFSVLLPAPPIASISKPPRTAVHSAFPQANVMRSEEHTSELQSHLNLVCRLLLEKKNKIREARCHVAQRVCAHMYTA